jgi:hypothetical protein
MAFSNKIGHAHFRTKIEPPPARKTLFIVVCKSISLNASQVWKGGKKEFQIRRRDNRLKWQKGQEGFNPVKNVLENLSKQLKALLRCYF